MGSDHSASLTLADLEAGSPKVLMYLGVQNRVLGAGAQTSADIHPL